RSPPARFSKVRALSKIAGGDCQGDRPRLPRPQVLLRPALYGQPFRRHELALKGHAVVEIPRRAEAPDQVAGRMGFEQIRSSPGVEEVLRAQETLLREGVERARQGLVIEVVLPQGQIDAAQSRLREMDPDPLDAEGVPPAPSSEGRQRAVQGE